MDCTFGYWLNRYCCVITIKKFILEVNEGNFKGKHWHSKSNADVTELQIKNSQLKKIPIGLGEVFKNLKELNIWESNLRTISKDDLKQFPHLKILNLSDNLLEDLPSDLFEFNKKIEEVYFNKNKIKYIGVEIFDELPKFISAGFYKNTNINIRTVYKNDETSFKNFKQVVLSKCQKPKNEIKTTKRKLNKQIPTKQSTTFFADLLKLSKNDEYKDFTIKVEDAEFKVHKFIFIARSETFAEMIKNYPDVNMLVLQDMPVEIFESILNYVYKDEMPKNIERTREIFAAAGKLKIEGLKENLAQNLIKKMNDHQDLDFLMENLNLGIKFECKALKLKAFEEIKKHFPQRKLKKHFMGQPEEIIKLINAKKMLDEQYKKYDMLKYVKQNK